MNQLEIKQEHIKVVVLFLEKLEKLTPEERREILKTIQWINNPMFKITP